MSGYINNKKEQLKLMKSNFEAIKRSIDFMGFPSDWEDERDLDDLWLEFDRYKTIIEEIDRLLIIFNNTQIYKKELIDKGDKMMYHPSRVSKLLDMGLISLNDSFDNL